MPDHQPTPQSEYLIRLARQNAEVYAALPTIRAILLTGSSTEGVSDNYSDLDIILYYDTLPSEDVLAAACQQNGGVNRRDIVPRSEEGIIEHYFVAGVECQFAHVTVAAWEAEIASVLDQHDVTSATQKALGGMAEAIPLYGESLIRQWQARLAHYPDALAQAMVTYYLGKFPVRGFQERMLPRDAAIWLAELRVEAAYALLGTLAGLNRLYFTTFQFKRMRRFIGQMQYAPSSFADRLEAVFHADAASAADQLDALARETLALVEQHMPQVDTSAAQKRLNWQPTRWTIPLDSADFNGS